MSHSEKRYGHRYIRIVPSLQCFECDALTSVALLNEPGMHHNFAPLCPKHGFPFYEGPEPTQSERELSIEAVSRFVLWMLNGHGSITSVEPVDDIAAIPGYIPRYYIPENADSLGSLLAWRVDYCKNGIAHECYAIWSNIESPAGQFYLYQRSITIALSPG